jgi:uncharacterized membrane protein YphA (DoxX/SURF4 family)
LSLRITIGVVWLTLALSKALEMEPAVDFTVVASGYGARTATALVYALILVEVIIGVGVLLPVQRLQRGCLLGTVVLAGLLALATLLLPSPQPCGCFGVLGRASGGQKLMVACGVLFLAVEYLLRYMPRNRR